MKNVKAFLGPKPLTLSALCVLLAATSALAQGPPRGFWPVPDSNPAHDRWQKAETDITPQSVANFKFLWKIKLGNEKVAAFSEPLLYPGLITGRGFKDLAFVTGPHTLYAVDSELGELVWQKDFPSGAASACGMLQVLAEPPQVIHFGARPAAGPRPAPPPPEAPLAPSQRRVGAAAGGGYFGLKGVYVLTPDGYLHEQIMATGLDYAPPVKFVPQAGGDSFALNFNNKVLYAVTSSRCHAAADAVWSIDLGSTDYAVNSYRAGKGTMAGLTGPAIGSDGTAYVVTGPGALHPNSVVSLTAKTLTIKDWYTPPAAQRLDAGPLVFTSKDKELIAAPGKDGSLVLLDSKSLGGPDHQTPLAQAGTLSKKSKAAAWQGLAHWQDKSGVDWILASIVGPLDPGSQFAASSGPAPHGSIVACKVEEKDGRTLLTPAWSSRDLSNPAPPVIANGVVFALDAGNASTHATLYALDAVTGKQLYSSGDAIQGYTHMAGISVGDGHVFFTTHDNTLYSFGIPMEH